MPASALVLSFDTELGWGAIESGRWRERQQRGVYRETRRALKRILAEMETLQITATWALVGGMLEPPGRQRLDHLPAAARQATAESLKAGAEDTFYGRDVLDLLLGRGAPHEIACHGYSHTRFLYEGVDAACIETELSLFAQTLPEEAGPARSLIFPSNQEGWLEVVSKAGYRVFRRCVGVSPWRRRWTNLLSLAPAASSLALHSTGLLCTSGSLFFDCARPYWLPSLRRRASRGLKSAVERGGVFHVWNHPFNFAMSQGLLPAFESFLRQAAQYREQGKLAILTMSQLSRQA